MPISVFRQSRCLNTSDSICDLFKWVCDGNDKGNEKSYVRANDRGLKISCHSCHLCHIQSRRENTSISLATGAVIGL